jgi:AcrR family transcriptional regulator
MGGTVAKALAGAAARRERSRQEMRDTILAAAGRIVAEEGIERLTMRRVAAAIGYSVAALYEYFPAKEALYACLYFAGSGGLTERMRETLASFPPEVTAQERLRALGHAYRAYAHEQTELFQLVFANSVPEFHPGEPEIEDSRTGFDLVVDLARDGVERGEFAAMPPMVIAIAVWTAVHGFVMLELSGHLKGEKPPGRWRHEGGAPPSPDELFEATLHLSAHGILRR